jgi:hypothetical protein
VDLVDDGVLVPERIGGTRLPGRRSLFAEVFTGMVDFLGC